VKELKVILTREGESQRQPSEHDIEQQNHKLRRSYAPLAALKGDLNSVIRRHLVGDCEYSSTVVTKETFPDDHYESVMRRIRATGLVRTIDGSANEMVARLATYAVYVVIFEVLAHFWQTIKRHRLRRQ
jgi:hypothetical protein